MTTRSSCMFCTKCGEKVKDGDNFCAKCGKKVERDAISEQANEGDVGGKPKSRFLALKIIAFGVVVVAMFVGGWFGWSAYVSSREKEKTLQKEREKQEYIQKQWEQARDLLNRGVPDFENIVKAVKLATPAAEYGNVDAQAMLGDCYRAYYSWLGYDPKWIEESAQWYLKAAKSGHRRAQGRIAKYYLEGFGLPKDPVQAYKWARKAGIAFEESSIQLETAQNGIKLDADKLPSSQLVIDVRRDGVYKVSSKVMTEQQILRQAQKLVQRHGIFPCLIRADKRAKFRHVGRVLGVCLMGRHRSDVTRFFFVALNPKNNPYEADVYTTFSARILSPSANASEVAEELAAFSIDIGPRGVYVNGEGKPFKELDNIIKKIAALSTSTRVFLRYAEDTPYGIFVQVLDSCNKYQLKNVCIFSDYTSLCMDSPNVSPVEAFKGDVEDADTTTEEEPPPPEEDDPPPPEVEPPPEDMETPDVQIDSPVVSPVESADQAPPTNEPVSMKPAVESAALVMPSTMTLKSVAGTARSAGMRGTFLTGGKMYGDATTERAVMKALRWLKATQEPDGSWGTKPELGLTKGMDKAAGTGFAVLTFLAHGETPASKEFGPTVEKALNYLINNVYVVKDKAGNEVKDPNDPSGTTPLVKMRGAGGSEYGFLIGTYALCEAYAMTKNPNARVAAEKTLARIIWGQTTTGGWNYNMKRVPFEGAPDDISFGGWAMQAIKAGKMAGIHVRDENGKDIMDPCIKKAVKCLKTRNYSEKAGFVYRATTNHKGGGGGLGGVGCLAMQMFGYAHEPEVANALRVMSSWAPTLDAKHMSGGANAQYYSYYAARCKYFAGMAKGATPANLTLWTKWNEEMKALYPKAIVTVMDQKTNKPYTVEDANGKPREIGHWVNGDHYNYDVMGTCLAALQLMVYYRYLPTSQLKAAESEKDVENLSKDKTEDKAKDKVDIDVSIDI